MSYAYDGFILPVILSENPGITREEIVARIPVEELRSCTNTYLLHGLEGLAYGFGLKRTKEFDEFKRNSRDPRFHYLPREVNCLLDGNIGYRRTHTEFSEITVKVFRSVGIYEEHILWPNDISNGILPNNLRVNDLELGDLRFKVMDVKRYSPRFRNSEFGIQILRLKPYIIHEEVDVFETQEELFVSYPEFDPRSMFDWSKESGKLELGLIDTNNCGRWYKKGNGYYLDKDHLMRTLKAGFMSQESGLGWTDFVLTKEAIRRNFWKLLSQYGLRHRAEFYSKYPEVKEIMARAVFDSETSLYAKRRGLSNTELLRMRLEFGFDILKATAYELPKYVEPELSETSTIDDEVRESEDLPF